MRDFFLGYNIQLLGTTRDTIYSFQTSISHVCQLLLLWDTQRWNGKNPLASLNPQHFWIFLFQEISSTKIKYALLNCERLLKLSTGSDLWCLIHEKMGLQKPWRQRLETPAKILFNPFFWQKNDIFYCILRDCLLILTVWMRNYNSYWI